MYYGRSSNSTFISKSTLEVDPTLCLEVQAGPATQQRQYCARTESATFLNASSLHDQGLSPRGPQVDPAELNAQVSKNSGADWEIYSTTRHSADRRHSWPLCNPGFQSNHKKLSTEVAPFASSLPVEPSVCASLVLL